MTDTVNKTKGGEWFYRGDDGWVAGHSYDDAVAEGRQYAIDSGAEEYELAYGVPKLLEPELFGTHTTDDIEGYLEEVNSSLEVSACEAAGIEVVHLEELRADLNRTYFEWVKRHDFRGNQLDLSQIETIKVTDQ